MSVALQRHAAADRLRKRLLLAAQSETWSAIYALEFTAIFYLFLRSWTGSLEPRVGYWGAAAVCARATNGAASASRRTARFLGVSFIPFLVYFMLSWRDHMRRSAGA